MQLKDVLDLESVKVNLNIPLGAMLKLPRAFPRVASRWFEDMCPSIDMYLMSLTGVQLGETVVLLPYDIYERTADFVEEDYPNEPIHSKAVMWYLIADKLLGYAHDKLVANEHERLKRNN